jgi:hypothetical protein
MSLSGELLLAPAVDWIASPACGVSAILQYWNVPRRFPYNGHKRKRNAP